MPRILTRAEAAERIRNHWLSTRTPEQLLAMHEPNWDRLRNYELEGILEKELGGEWVIGEWCPFNGIHCNWLDHCPLETLDALIAEYESDPAALRRAGVNPDMRMGHLRDVRRRRSSTADPSLSGGDT